MPSEMHFSDGLIYLCSCAVKYLSFFVITAQEKNLSV